MRWVQHVAWMGRRENYTGSGGEPDGKGPLGRLRCRRKIKLKFILKKCSGLGQHSWYSDSLWAGRSGDWIPVGARFSAPVQTVPGAHGLLYNGYLVSFPGVKWLGRGVDHPPPSSAKVKERVELYLYSPSGPLWPVTGQNLPLPFTLKT